MAMNKKELQEMADLRIALAKAKALHFTESVDYDIPVPGYGDGLKVGYGYNLYNCSVSPACSSSHSHSYGRIDKTDSQKSIPLFSTKIRALKALRNAMEDKFAGELARIDVQIAKEQSSTDTLKEWGMCNRELTIQEEYALLAKLDEDVWQKTLDEFVQHEPFVGRTVLAMRKIIEIYVKHLNAKGQ